MSNLPLHPIIVHVPLVLALFGPLVCLTLAVAIARGRLRRRAWIGTIVLYALVVCSGVVALRSGEEEEERAERWIGEARIEDHEHAAERFVWWAGATLALGFLPLALRRRDLQLAAMGSVIVLGGVGAALGVQTGHTGGEIVYGAGGLVPWADGASADGQVESDDDD